MKTATLGESKGYGRKMEKGWRPVGKPIGETIPIEGGKIAEMKKKEMVEGDKGACYSNVSAKTEGRVLRKNCATKKEERTGVRLKRLQCHRKLSLFSYFQRSSKEDSFFTGVKGGISH